MSDAAREVPDASQSRITEPATMVTDYLLAVLALGFATAIWWNFRGRLGYTHGGWIAAYAATAVGAITGGTVHGFTRSLGPARTRQLWETTQYAMGVASLALLVGAIASVTSGALRSWLLAAAVIKFVIYVAVVARRDEFVVVIIDYGLSMIALAIGQGIAWAQWDAPSAPWILAGVGVSVVAAVIQATKVAPHRHFNHNDLYHVIQMAALYLLYRGGLLIADR